MFSVLQSFVGSMIGKVTLVLIAGLLSVIGLLWLQNTTYKSENSTLTSTNAQLQTSLTGYINQLDLERKETQRVNDINKDLVFKLANAKPVIQTRIEYVKTYAKDTSIPKCVLSSRWVQLHNLYTTSPYRTSTETNTR